jgi:hypothetical protein
MLSEKKFHRILNLLLLSPHKTPYSVFFPPKCLHTYIHEQGEQMNVFGSKRQISFKDCPKVVMLPPVG